MKTAKVEVWSIADVLDVRPDLTHEQATHVIREMQRQHDASIEIGWDTIRVLSDILYPQNHETN